MSQDWWPASSTSFSTPSRPQSHPSGAAFASTPSAGGGGFGFGFGFGAPPPSNGAGAFQPALLGATANNRARFAGDELDPEDSKGAENVKFFPTFSSTPAGKAYQASGGSIVPGASVGSPGAGGASPGVRRSPQHRFSFGTSPNDAMSPRNRGATGRSTTQYAPQSPIDEDGPPTLSLRDAPSSPPPSSLSTNQPASPSPALLPPASSSFSSIPPPPGLRATSETTTLYVFGPPPDQLPLLRDWLEECGQITAYHPAVPGGYYFQVTYASPIGASYALRRHGELVGNKWMVGFKVVEPGQGVSPPDAPGGPGLAHSSVPGSRIVVHDKGSVIKPKSAAAAGAVQKKGQDGNGWDEGEAPGGIMNKAAEWLFGR